jgi:hypothetical protein
MADAGLPAAEPLPESAEWVVPVHLLSSWHRVGWGVDCGVKIFLADLRVVFAM